LNPV
jgi:hypothetical protein